MVKAYSLHIGINEYKKDFYPESVNRLYGCVNDMNTMQEIATHFGIPKENTCRLPNHEATCEAVQIKVVEIRKKMKDGDLFFFTFAGHGFYVPDEDGDEGEERGNEFDGAICLYDGIMVDDMILTMFLDFPPLSRIICVFDSCHSGSVIKLRDFERTSYEFDELIPRKLTKSERSVIWRQNGDNIFRELGEAKTLLKQRQSNAIGVSLSACEDGIEKRAYEKNGKGLFSNALRQELLEDKFVGSYREVFHNVLLNADLREKNQVPVILALPTVHIGQKYFFNNERFLQF